VCNLTILRGKSVCLFVCQSLLAPFLLHGRGPRPRHLSHWALGTCPHLAPTYPRGQFEGAGVELSGLLPTDSAKPVSLAHRVVFHGGKLPSIGRGASSVITFGNNSLLKDV